MDYYQQLKELSTEKRQKLKACSEATCLVASVWDWIRTEAEVYCEREPIMNSFLQEVILSRATMGQAVIARIMQKIHGVDLSEPELVALSTYLIQENPTIEIDFAYDLWAITDRDPACISPLHALLFYKGFHAVSTYRLAHALWQEGRQLLAAFFQNTSSEVFGVDIHPAAQIGHGIFIDHATGCVIGETSIVEDDVSLLHAVTLGGTGKEEGERHPIVRSGVLIGAGAKLLGRVTIGECAKIGAGSVVLDDVPPHVTVVGVPAEVVGETTEQKPALNMEQNIKHK